MLFVSEPGDSDYDAQENCNVAILLLSNLLDSITHHYVCRSSRERLMDHAENVSHARAPVYLYSAVKINSSIYACAKWHILHTHKNIPHSVKNNTCQLFC